MAEIDVTRIAGNIGAMNALNSLSGINKQLSVHQTRLATGKRINSAADDPAGLTIATKMLSRSEGLKVALNNIGDAKNLLAVAESGLGRINDILVQMRNKAEAAASDTMGTDERTAIKTQLLAFAEQVDDIVKQTSWNSKKLLDGAGSPLRFQTGADSTDSTTMEKIANVGAGSLGIVRYEALDSASGGTGSGAVTNIATNAADLKTAGFTDGTYTMKYTVSNFAAGASATLTNDDLFDLNVKFYDSAGTEVTSLAKTVAVTEAGATTPVNLGNGVTLTVDASINAANATEVTAGTLTLNTAGYHVDANSAQEFANYMDDVQDAMNIVNAEMSKVGALTGRMTFKEDQISASQINTEAAYNRIMNANMAEEQVNASKFQILQQTATAMLAQANAAPQFLLSLFR
jgi:flagellin